MLADVPASGVAITVIVVVCVALGLAFAALYAYHTSLISVHGDLEDVDQSLLDDAEGGRAHDKEDVYATVREISTYISEGANAFLRREYMYMGVFMVLFSVVILVVIGVASKPPKGATETKEQAWEDAAFTALAFNAGAATSILSGYVGMKIAVYANSRTTLEARHGYGPAFVTAFKAGAVMGFALVSFGVMILYILVNVFHLYYDNITGPNDEVRSHLRRRMFEAVAGYGLGGSSIALFGRVGGGIYTKAADVGADLCGKIEFDIPEDDPRNPAVIADNVGDNVGDVAGMGADLFGSFAEATCAAMVISAESDDLGQSWASLLFPITITATGIVVSIITSFFATHLMVVKKKEDIEPSLKRQILVSTILQTPVAFLLCYYLLPRTPFAASVKTSVRYWHVFVCICCGLWSGLVIGYTTEYYTSHSYRPVRDVAEACKSGAATNIIYGLALGYKSVIIPVFCLAITIYVGYSLAGMYGIAVAALGILSTMSIGLAIDAYGPICDNAGGIAEMAEMGAEIRERTDALDAAGNTTAAIGKGFAIGSAALVSLALFGAFVTTVELPSVDILEPFDFAGLLVGAMLPYWFSAMTMKSVGFAALAMVDEVRDQLTKNPDILNPEKKHVKPDYARCVDISTRSAIAHMIPPGALVMLTPLIVGFLFGTKALAGLLAGALVSGVQMAISASNTGGAWDNAKKYIEGGALGGKGSDVHKAAVVGDTVGDPLKDTSGPSLNILIKLMAIISLVFARSFPRERGWIEQIFHH